MRGGRNKFGPMYKRDRARKLQMLRQRQMSQQGILSGRGIPSTSTVGITYSSAYTSTPSHVQIKEEIQSPFLSSSTSSPDSSPSPMAGLGILPPTSGPVSVVTGGGNNNVALLSSPELSLWVGDITATPPAGAGGGGGGTGGGNTGSGNNRLPVGGPATANNATNSSTNSRVPLLVRQLVAQLDDNEWQSSLFNLLQNQTYNQCEVDLFELLCKVLDQNLFAQVDWARNSIFFKDLRVS